MIHKFYIRARKGGDNLMLFYVVVFLLILANFSFSFGAEPMIWMFLGIIGAKTSFVKKSSVLK
jgi:hypothetical protein